MDKNTKTKFLESFDIIKTHINNSPSICFPFLIIVLLYVKFNKTQTSCKKMAMFNQKILFFGNDFFVFSI